MKYLMILLTLFIITGCERDHSMEIINDPLVYCIGGVAYYVIGYSASVAFNKDSTVITCDMGNGNVNK